MVRKKDKEEEIEEEKSRIKEQDEKDKMGNLWDLYNEL